MRVSTVSIFIAIILFGCGGGGGGGAASGGNISSNDNSGSNNTPVVTLASGIFIDSPVNGLEYTGSPSDRSGITGASGVNGQFTVATGDTVTFKLGNLVIGTTAPVINGNIITPETLTGSLSSPVSPLAVRIAQLLQSLDSDRNPSNGINIASVVRDRLRDNSVNAGALQLALQNDQNFEGILGGMIQPLTSGNANRGQNEIVSNLSAMGELLTGLEIAARLNFIWPSTGAPIAIATATPAVPDFQILPIPPAPVLTLDGRRSFDPDNEPLIYLWSIISQPVGANAILSSPNSAITNFTFPDKGDYRIELKVTDSSGLSSVDSIGISNSSSGVFLPIDPPVANAGQDRTLSISPDRIFLDGTSSSNPGGLILFYNWSIISRPTGSNISLLQSNTSRPSFIASVPGDYVFQLRVTGIGGISSVDTVRITLRNDAPVAHAGADIAVSITPGGVLLNGASSFDPNNQLLTYAWSVVSQPGGANTQLSSSSISTPGFISTVPGEYTFRLTVTDPFGLSNVDTVKITLEDNRPVVHVAPFDVNLVIGESIYFDASSSYDPGSASLSYTWRLTSLPDDSGIPVEYSGSTPTITFDVPGSYNVEIEVSNGNNSRIVKLDPIDVTVYNTYQLSHIVTDAEYDRVHRRVITLSGNTAYAINVDTGVETAIPLSLAGAAISVAPDGNHAAVAHNGWISHIDLNTNTVIAINSVPADLGDVVIDNYSYVYGFPRTGQWVKMLIVNMVTGAIRENTGGNIREGTRAKLHPDGEKIYGADNGISPSDLERYSIGGGSASLVYDSPYHGDYPFWGDLWIEQEGELMLARSGVVVRSTNHQSSDMTFVMALNLDSGIQHADTNAFTNEWLVLNGTNSRFGSEYLQTYDLNSGTRMRRFKLPRFETDITKRWFGQYVFGAQSSNGHFILAVNNTVTPTNSVLLASTDFEYSASNRPPAAVVPRFRTKRVFETVRVDGSASSDPEGMALTYNWNLISQPVGSNVTLYDTTSAEVYFTPELPGVYELGLVVNDGTRNSPVARVDINVFSVSSNLVHRLEDTVQDAEYSEELNSLVYIVPNDNSLHLLDLNNFTGKKVELGQIPYTVGVAPDGLKAAISQAGKVTLVDLQAASVIDTQSYPADWGDVVLDHNGRAHLIPYRDQWVSLYSMDFVANSFRQTSGSVRANTQIRMHPVENWIYGADRGLSPSDFEKYNVSSYPPSGGGDSPYHGDYPISGNIWISEAGNRMLVAGARIFHSSSNSGIDMTYAGALPDNIQVLWASHSVEARQWAVITGNQSNPSLGNKLYLYTDDFFNRQSLNGFSPIPTPQGDVPATANASSRVFYNAAGTKVILITYGSGLANGYAVEIRDLQ